MWVAGVVFIFLNYKIFSLFSYYSTYPKVFHTVVIMHISLQERQTQLAAKGPCTCRVSSQSHVGLSCQRVLWRLVRPFLSPWRLQCRTLLHTNHIWSRYGCRLPGQFELADYEKKKRDVNLFCLLFCVCYLSTFATTTHDRTHVQAELCWVITPVTHAIKAFCLLQM